MWLRTCMRRGKTCRPLQACEVTHWRFFSRNIVYVTPEINCFYYLIKYFLDQSIQKINYLIFKKASMVSRHASICWCLKYLDQQTSTSMHYNAGPRPIAKRWCSNAARGNALVWQSARLSKEGQYSHVRLSLTCPKQSYTPYINVLKRMHTHFGCISVHSIEVAT